MGLVSLFIVLVLVYGLVSGRLARTILTPPILFTAAGMAASLIAPDLPHLRAAADVFLHAAEAGLVLLLFTDASKTDLRVLRAIRTLPFRLLTTGMLLTLLLGGLAAMVVFRHLTLWEAGILAAILAPTDAGLGQVIVSSPLVPLRVRQALNIEAGLNDGLSVPFLLFFIAYPATHASAEAGTLSRFVVEQLGYGVLIGGGIGLAGGFLLRLARDRSWMAPQLVQLCVVSLAVLCILASTPAGASMFIAAFVAGLTVQVRFKDAGRHGVEFTEQWGQLLNFSIFFLFGVLVVRNWGEFAWSHVLYAVLSLTVVRMLPVALALIGTRLSAATVLFMGWFGPRGLASIVLGLVYLEHEPHSAGEPTIRIAVMVTVLISILAHGASALPGIRWYAAKTARLAKHAPEHHLPGAEHPEPQPG